MYESEKIYDDIDAAGIESLALTQLHRPVDAAITAADAEGASCLLDHVYTGQQDLNFFQEYVKSYIIIPATVFGRSKNGFTEAYLQNTHSIQIPALIHAGLDRGQGGAVGLGKNKWGNVHIDERKFPIYLP